MINDLEVVCFAFPFVEAAFFLDEIMADEDKIVLMIPYNYPVLYYSAVHDLRFGGDEAATEENVANDSDEPYYLYILFPKGEDERFVIESERLDELKVSGEFIFEWESSILRRTLINGDWNKKSEPKIIEIE